LQGLLRKKDSCSQKTAVFFASGKIAYAMQDFSKRSGIKLENRRYGFLSRACIFPA
jgi:hypothetical protein